MIESGYESTTQSRWVRVFFVAFHIVGVILVNNLVIAFVINKFLQQLGVLRQQHQPLAVDGEAVIRDQTAVFDASSVTGTQTTLKGAYIARLRHEVSDIGDEHHHDRLREMFTPKQSFGDG